MQLTAWTLLLISVSTASAQELVPFVLPWDDASAGAANRSDLLPRPAGALGPVRAGSDGHLYVGERRIRFLGVNTAFGGNFPRHEDAERIAGRLAKFGINAVRFHHMDMRPFPDGIRARNVENTRELDPEALDRLDYFIAQLKENGIYADLNLLVSRPFNRADGLPAEIEELGWKERHIVGFFYEPELDLQKEYARRLLTHRNAYTGMTYAEEPAVAFVEINNENGLIHAWLGGRVDRLPEVFRDDLARQWNAWLTARYADTAALRKAWGVREEPTGPELLRNPRFEENAREWTLEQHEQARANLSVEAGPEQARAVRIDVTATSSAAWHVQFNESALAVEADRPYTLSFRAKSDAARTIAVQIGQAHDPWGSLGFRADVPLTTEWQTFRYTFLLARGDENARVNFSNLARSTGAIWLADVSLRPGGVVGLREGERLEDGSLPAFARARFGERTPEARRDWIRFLRQTEERYWQSIDRYLKEDLGVIAPVIGTIVATSTPNLMAELDVVDTHAYWQHPKFPGRPWDAENWFVPNVSMVNTPGGVLAGLAQQRVHGKPHLVTEYNHAAPNTYSSEAPLLLAAFAGMQDWDGVFLFAYSHRRDDWNARRIMGFFDIDQHPLKMANMALAASLFLRGDVQPAREEVIATLPPEREIDILQREGRAWGLVSAANLGVPRAASLLHRLSLHVGDAPIDATSAPVPDVEGRERFVSDTGELVWDLSREGKGVVTVNAARTKAVIGFVDGRAFSLGEVTIAPGETRQDWVTIGLTLVEGDSFSGPGRALLVATGDAENTNMGWKNAEKTTVGRDWGEAPSLVEVIPAVVTLPRPADRVRVWALDEQGQRADEIPVRVDGDRAAISIGPPARTLWYEVELR